MGRWEIACFSNNRVSQRVPIYLQPTLKARKLPLIAQFFPLQIYFGVWVTVCVTASWVGATHSIKYLYLRRPKDNEYDDPILVPHDTTDLNMTVVQTKYVSRKKCNVHWFSIPFRSNLCHYLTDLLKFDIFRPWHIRRRFLQRGLWPTGPCCFFLYIL